VSGSYIYILGSHCGLWLQAGRHSQSHRSGKTTQRLAARLEDDYSA
jgi:hypothetical protein